MQEGTKVIINYMFMSLNQFYLWLTEMMQSFPCGKLTEMQLTKMMQSFFVTQTIKLDPWHRRKWQPTPIFLSKKFHRQRNLESQRLGHYLLLFFFSQFNSLCWSHCQCQGDGLRILPFQLLLSDFQMLNQCLYTEGFSQNPRELLCLSGLQNKYVEKLYPLGSDWQELVEYSSSLDSELGYL